MAMVHPLSLWRVRSARREGTVPALEVIRGECARVQAELEAAGTDWRHIVTVIQDLEPLANQLTARIHAQGKSGASKTMEQARQQLWDCMWMVQPYRPYRPGSYLRDRVSLALRSVEAALGVAPVSGSAA